MARNLYRDSLVKYETIALDYQIPIWKEGSNSDGVLKRITLRDFFASDVITTIIQPPNWATNNLVVVGNLTHDLNGHTVTLNGGGHTLNSSVTFRAEGPTFLPNATQDNSITKLMVLDSNGRVKFKDASSDFNKLGFISVTQAVDLDQIETDVSANNSKVSNVSTSLSTGTRDGSNYGITSDGGVDDLVLLPASTTLAGLLTAVKLGEINANTLKVGVTTSQANAIIANTAKITNAIHTGEVTGSGVLTVQPTLISGKTVKSVLAGTEEILVNDGGTFKKVLASNFGGDTIFTGGTMSAPSTIVMGGNDLTFDGGKTTFKGSGSTSANTALLVENSISTQTFKVLNSGYSIFGTGTYASGGGGVSYFTIRSTNSINNAGLMSCVDSSENPIFTLSNGYAAINSNTDGISSLRVKSINNQPIYVSDKNSVPSLFQFTDVTKGGTMTGVGDFGTAFNVSNRQNAGWFVLQPSTTTGATLEMLNGVDPTGVALKNGTIWYNSGFNLKGGTKLIGSGSTSATTALLVQNALGANLLEVKDDGTILGNLPNIYGADGTLTGARTVTMADNDILLQRSSLSGAGGLIIGSGSRLDNFTPLTIKGSNNSRIVSALINENSGGYASIRAFNDSNQTMEFTSIGTTRTSSGSFLSGKGLIQSQNLEGIVFNHSILGGTEGSYFFTGLKSNGTNPSASEVVFNIQSNRAYFGGGDTVASARVHIKGTGSTSATTALLVQNALGTNLLEVKDDGSTEITGRLKINSNGGGYGYSLYQNVTPANIAASLHDTSLNSTGIAGTLDIYNDSASKVIGLGGGSAYDFINTGRNFGIGTATPTKAKLEVEGNGRISDRLAVATDQNNAWITIGASVSNRSHFRLIAGANPTPQDGSIWFDGTDLKMHIAGVTKTFTLV